MSETQDLSPGLPEAESLALWVSSTRTRRTSHPHPSVVSPGQGPVKAELRVGGAGRRKVGPGSLRGEGDLSRAE